MKLPAMLAPGDRRSGRVRACGIAIVLALAALPSSAAAQDANYWAIPYGPIGQLLGGVLIGSARDLSATYYNPGGLVLTADPTFLISVDALDREKWTIKSRGVPAGTFDLASTRTAAAPSIIAGSLPGSSGPGTRLAWSYLPRFSTHLQTNERKITGSGSDLVASEVVVSEDLSESWFGGTWSHLTGDSLGVGVTGYLAYRGYTYRNEFNAQADPAGSGATVLLVDNTRYHNYRLLAKLGAAMDRGPFQLGLTITTPSLGLFGSGDIGFTRSVTGIDLDGDQVPDNFLLRGYADDLDADYRSSWAVGAGGSWLYGKTRLHLSGEWYNSVQGEILASEPLSPGQGRDDIVLDLDQDLDDVFNVGVGVEQELSAKTSLYGSFFIDQSPVAESQDPLLSTASWDLYHLSVGAATRFLGSRVTGGVGYSFGSADKPNLFKHLYPGDTPIDPGDFEMEYSRFTFLVGFELSGSKRDAPAGK